MANNKKISTGKLTWLKNAAKSVGYSIGDLSQELAPATTDSIHSMIGSGSDLKMKLDDFMSSKSIYTNKTSDGINKYKNEIKDAFKTGNFYRKSSMDIGDFDFDNSFSMDDDMSESINDLASTVNSNTVELSDMIKFNTDATLKSNSKLHELNAKSTQVITSAITSGNIAIHGSLNAINDNIIKLVEFNNKNMLTYIDASLTYYNKNIEELEMRKKARAKRATDGSSVMDIFSSGGGLDFSQYAKYIKKQSINALDESGIGMIAPMLSMGNSGSGPGSMINMALTMAVGLMMGKPAKKFIEKMDKQIGSLIPNLLGKIGNLQDSDNPILSLIGNIFGIKTRSKTSVDLGNYERGEIGFDGYSKKALTSTIPGYLSRILATLNGGTEIGFSYKTGKFFDIKKARSDMNKAIRSDVNISQSDILDAFDKQMELMKMTREEMDRSRKDFEDFLYNSTINGSGTLSLNRKKDKYGVIKDDLSQYGSFKSDKDKEIVRAILDKIKKSNPDILAKSLGMTMLQSRLDVSNRFNAYDDDILESGLDMMYMFDDIDSGGSLQSKKVSPTTIKKSSLNKIKSKFSGTSSYGVPASRIDEIESKMDIVSGEIFNYVVGDSSNVTNEKPSRFEMQIDNQLNKTGNLFETKLINPLKEKLIGENGVFTKVKESEQYKAFERFFIGEKDDVTGRRQGGIFNGVRTEFRNMSQRISYEFTGKENKELGLKENPNSIFGNLKSTFSDIGMTVNKSIFGDKVNDLDSDKGVIKTGFKGLLGSFIETTQTGFQNFSNALFGPSILKDGTINENHVDMSAIYSGIKEKLPKGISRGIIGAGGGLIVGGSLGLMGTLIGGPIGGATIGMTVGLLTQSNKFMNLLFGKEEDGERQGGLISKQIQDWTKQNKSNLIAGGSIGAIGGIASSIGLLPSFILPGGPIGGALIGAATSIAFKSDKVQHLLFGDPENEDSKGLLTSVLGKMKGKDAAANIKTGAISGAAISLIGSKLGLLGGMFLGGPIGGALVGSAAGIALSSAKWRDMVFGTEDEATGIRKGGWVERLSNFAKDEVLTPFTLFMKERGLRLYELIYKDVMLPLYNSIEPLVETVKTIGSKVSHGIATGINKVFGTQAKTVGDVAKNAIKQMALAPFKLVNAVTKPLRQALWWGTKKIVGGATNVLTAIPFKLFGGALYGAQNIAGRFGARDEYKRNKRKIREDQYAALTDKSTGFRERLSNYWSIGKQIKDLEKPSHADWWDNYAEGRKSRFTAANEKFKGLRADLRDEKRAARERQKISRSNGYLSTDEDFLKRVNAAKRRGPEAIAMAQKDTMDKIHDKMTSLADSIHGGVMSVIDVSRASQAGIDVGPLVAKSSPVSKLLQKISFGRKIKFKQKESQEESDLAELSTMGDDFESDDSIELLANAESSDDNSLVNSASKKINALRKMMRDRFNKKKYDKVSSRDSVSERLRLLKKKEQSEEAIYRETSLGLQEEQVESQTGFQFEWSAIFGKKGLITGALLIGIPLLINFLRDPSKFLSGLGGIISKTVGDFFGNKSALMGAKDSNKNDVNDKYELAGGAEIENTNLTKDGILAGKYVYSKGFKLAKKGYAAAKDGVAAVKGAGDVAKGAFAKIKGKMGGAVDDVAKPFTQVVDKTVMAAADSGVGSKFGGIFKTVMDVIKKILSKFIKEDSIVGKIFTKVSSLGQKAIAKAVKVQKFVAKMTQGISKILNPVVLEIAFGAYGALTGWSDAETAKLFNVKQSEIDAKMKLISSIMNAVLNIGWFFIIDIINEITMGLMGFDFLKQFAEIIYQFLGGNVTALKEAQRQFDESYSKNADLVKAIGGGDLSKDAYNEFENMSVTTKAWKGVKDIVGRDVRNFTGVSASEKDTLELAKTKYALQQLEDKIKSGEIEKDNFTHEQMMEYKRKIQVLTNKQAVGESFGSAAKRKDEQSAQVSKYLSQFADGSLSVEITAEELGLSDKKDDIGIFKTLKDAGGALKRGWDTFAKGTLAYINAMKEDGMAWGTAVFKGDGVLSSQYWSMKHVGDEENPLGGFRKFMFYGSRISGFIPGAIIYMNRKVSEAVQPYINAFINVSKAFIKDAQSSYELASQGITPFSSEYWAPPTDENDNKIGGLRRIQYYAQRILMAPVMTTIAVGKKVGDIVGESFGKISSNIMKLKNGFDDIISNATNPDVNLFSGEYWTAPDSDDPSSLDKVSFYALRVLTLPGALTINIGSRVGKGIQSIVDTIRPVFDSAKDEMERLDGVSFGEYWAPPKGESNEGLGVFGTILHYTSRVLYLPTYIMRKIGNFAGETIKGKIDWVKDKWNSLTGFLSGDGGTENDIFSADSNYANIGGVGGMPNQLQDGNTNTVSGTPSTNKMSADQWFNSTLDSSRVTNKYNQQWDGSIGYTRHTGIDYAPPKGANPKIYSPVDGTVVSNKSDSGGYGNHIIVQDKAGLYHLFAHMKNPSSFTTGSTVNVNEAIGLVGSSGNSTGDHLHYEVRTVNKYNSDIDPNSIDYTAINNGIAPDPSKLSATRLAPGPVSTSGAAAALSPGSTASNTQKKESIFDIFGRIFGKFQDRLSELLGFGSSSSSEGATTGDSFAESSMSGEINSTPDDVARIKGPNAGPVYDIPLNQHDPAITTDVIRGMIPGNQRSSPFFTNANVIESIAKRHNVNAAYVLAHGALESGWGQSKLAKEKNNYFGIEAYNSDPYNAAKTFGDGFETGMDQGVSWIKKNFFDGNPSQNTLNKMLYGKPGHVYAVNDDGTPNTKWAETIGQIMNNYYSTNSDAMPTQNPDDEGGYQPVGGAKSSSTKPVVRRVLPKRYGVGGAGFGGDDLTSLMERAVMILERIESATTNVADNTANIADKDFSASIDNRTLNNTVIKKDGDVNQQVSPREQVYDTESNLKNNKDYISNKAISVGRYL